MGRRASGIDSPKNGILMARMNVIPKSGDPKEIKRLVKAAQQVGRGDPYQGKRERTRFSAGMKLEVTLDPLNSGASYHVTMQNVSEGGFAFWSKRELRPETVIRVREFSPGVENEWVAAEVRHCTTGLRGYLVGAKFENPVPVEPQSRRLVR